MTEIKSRPVETTYDRSEATGLDYAVNRFYSPQQGRFTQVDPIGMGAASLGDPQTLNMYAYCGNDPINNIDPDGLFFGKLFGWIGKAFKWAFRVAAVAVAVIAVIAAASIGQVWGGIEITKLLVAKLFASSALLATAGWAPGKVGQIAAAIVTGGLSLAGNFRTPSTFPGGAGVGSISRFVQQRDIPQEYLDIVSEEWSLLEDGTVLYEVTMNVTECVTRTCVWDAIKRGVKIGTKNALKNVFSSPWALASAALFRGRVIRVGKKWRPRSITDPACRNGCDKVAKQIQKHIGGEIITIKPPDGAAFQGNRAIRARRS